MRYVKLVVSLCSASALAQETAPPPPAPAAATSWEQRAGELDMRLRIVERSLELERKKNVEARRVDVGAAPGKGFSVVLQDGSFAMTVRARAQARDTLSYAGDEVENEINVKTLRLWVQGNVLAPDVRYNLQLAFGGGDFEAGSSSPIFDAFVEFTRWRDLNVRVGQYFVPFDRARTIREYALQFVDRQAVVQELTLDRDVGVMLSSHDLGGLHGVLGYHLFIGGGDGRNRFGASPGGFLYLGRAVLRPWGRFDDDEEGDLTRAPRPRLAIGVAGGYNQATNRQRSTSGATNTTSGRFDYAHLAADLVFKHSGFSLLGEVVWRQALQPWVEGTVNAMTVREWSRSGLGYLVQAGQMVHPWVEVVARWEQLFALGETDPALTRLVAQQGRQAGGGLNVYLNGHQFKVQADYFYLFGDDAAQGRHQVRVQLDTTF